MHKIKLLIFTMLLSFSAMSNAANIAYCTGDNCPEKPPGTLNNEYPNAVCMKEYQCEGFYALKTVANRCGCCACNGGSCGCAGSSIVCCDGTLSQVCECQFILE